MEVKVARELPHVLVPYPITILMAHKLAPCVLPVTLQLLQAQLLYLNVVSVDQIIMV